MLLRLLLYLAFIPFFSYLCFYRSTPVDGSLHFSRQNFLLE